MTTKPYSISITHFTSSETDLVVELTEGQLSCFISGCMCPPEDPKCGKTVALAALDATDEDSAVEEEYEFAILVKDENTLMN